MQPLARAVLVFLFMSVLTLQAWSRFLDRLPGGDVSNGVQGINAFLDFTLVSRIGTGPATGVLVLLTLVFTVLVYRRGATEVRQPTTVMRPRAAAVQKDRMSKALQPQALAVPRERLARIVKLQAPAVPQSQQAGIALDGAAMAREFLARSGKEGRAERLPAWALLFRSPFAAAAPVTSWLGGLPQAPADFAWPNDVDGKPLHFLAQIDLASLKPEPQTGLRPPGLPERGALLVFVGQSYACRILSADEIGRSAPVALPEELEPVSKHGFFSDERSFTWRPVDPVAYLGTVEERPASLPNPFARPADWITNWAIAALEAEIVVEGLRLELKFAREFEERRRRSGDAFPTGKVVESKIAHYTLMMREAPELLAAVEAWRQTALSKPPEDRVDEAGLDAIFRRRMALSDAMTETYQPKLFLPGRAAMAWQSLVRAYPQLRIDHDCDELPLRYRPFAEAWITGWRRHRLFGLEPEFPNNWEDLRGQDCLISIAADELLNTRSEHEYGMSIWCPRQQLAEGRHAEGQFVRHCAV